MPRRPSAAITNNISNSSMNSSQTRVHKNNDSHHHIFGQSQSSTSLGASATPQNKIIAVLVNRLKNKLPCNSGVHLDHLEADNATQQAIDALINLSHESLDMIAFNLGELLQRLAEQGNTVEILQSQLFILKVLSVAMASRWLSSNPRSSSRTSNDDAKRTATRPGPADQPSTPVPWSEPPPLEESCAKYILSVMVLFLRQTTVQDDSLLMPSSPFSDVSFRDYETADALEVSDLPEVAENGTSGPRIADFLKQELRTRPSSSSFKSTGKMSTSSYILVPGSSAVYEKTHMSSVKSATSLNNHIRKFAGRIIFHISASNWKVVFHRLRAKIHMMASDDISDTVDLHILTHSVLDKQRLFHVFNELSSLLVNMNPEAHRAIAGPLRSAIWSWVDHFPSEFNEAIRSRGKMEGVSGVFDLLYTKSSGSERVLWPCLVILHCINPERVTSDIQSIGAATGGRASNRAAKFTEEVMRPSNYYSKLGQASLVCATDLCRAAMNVKAGLDEVPLQMLAFDVAHEIKSQIFNPSRKSFWEYTEEIDVALFAEALVSIFRFSPEEDALALFSVCVEAERSEAVKICAVRAALTLVQEAPRFVWQKPLTKLESLMAPRLRAMHLAICSRRPEVDTVGIRRSASYPKVKHTHSQPLTDKELLVLAILSLWRAHTPFFLSEMKEEQEEEWSNGAVKVWESPLNIAVKISAATASLHEAKMAFMMKSHVLGQYGGVKWLHFAMITTLTSVVTSLMNDRTNVDHQRLWTRYTLQILELFRRPAEHQNINAIQRNPARVPAFLLTEIALLVTLPSADNGISHLAAQGLRLLAHLENQSGAPVNPTVSEDDQPKRYPVYDRLGDPKIIVVGRVGHQKRVRKLLRLMPYCAAVNVAVWSECYWRWRALLEFVVDEIGKNGDDATIRKGRSNDTITEKICQWQNLTLFLASTAGTCLQEHDPVLLASAIPAKQIPDKLRKLESPVTHVTTFVNDLTALLIFEDVQIRDTAREALGAELSSRLYKTILKYFDDVVGSVAESSDNKEIREITSKDNILLFADQFIAVLKLITEHTSARQEIVSIDIGPTLEGLALLIVEYGTSESSRIKSKFCVLCESVCDRTESLMLRKDNITRKNLLETIITWIQTPDPTLDSAYVQYELNMACLRTIVKLLDRLQLGSPEAANGDDTVHTVSRLFNRYSTILLNGFDYCQAEPPTSDSVSELGSMQIRMRSSNREAELRELIITGLSHLVSANSESGFKQCLPLAYHEDSRKRTIFTHVFARVISQGTKFDAKDQTVGSNGQHRLVELVKEADMTLVIALCETCPPTEVDGMISVLLNLFDTRTSLIKLIKVMIDREVANTENDAALFRGNSTCTRFLSAFARVHGYNYLRSLVAPLIKCMESLPSGQGYELDPAKAGEQDVVQNRKNVEFVAESFLQIIVSSTSALPSMFREICVHIAKTVYDRWPDAKFAALGAFVFLRFISPAVVTPETIDLESPNDSLRRGLTLIAKIIQNLANNIFFGKEAHMMVLNDFLRDHIAHVTRYLSELNRYTPGEGDDDEWLGTAADDTDIAVLHRFFDRHADKIGKELLSITKPSADSGKRAWDALCTLLVDLGPPLEPPKPSMQYSKEHRLYKDLMARHEGKSTDAVQHIFVSTGLSSDPHDPVYFVLRFNKIDVEALDLELLMYHMFKLLLSPEYQDAYVEIVVDCTDLTSISELPIPWVKVAIEFIPADIRSKMLRTHFLNPNTLTQKYLRRMYNISSGNFFFGEVKTWSSISDLLPHVPATVIESPALNDPLSLEKEPSDLFAEVTMKIDQNRVPVNLTIGITHIRITSIRAVNVSPGIACKSTDIILLADVSDVYNVQTGQETNEFIIRRSRQGDTLYFTSPAREIIIRTIRAAKARLRDHQNPIADRFMRFSNVPATLLHVGFLSVDMFDEELRAGAYDLLGAVCKYLNYEKGPVGSKAGFIPGDMMAFVINLSGRIAQFAPQLTLDFISEVSTGIVTMKTNHHILQRINCLRYMSPWIKNLDMFANPLSSFYDRSGARLRDCVRVMSDLAVAVPELATNAVQKYVWSEVARLDSGVVDIIFDELVRTATDGGIGSHRCETIAHSVAALSCISVRGRLHAKLRKAIIKASPRLSRSPAENSGWPEVATLLRITLIAGFETNYPSHNQLYVPEVIHVVSLVAGVGSTLVRKTVYGIIINLLQSLYMPRLEEGIEQELKQLIADCSTQEVLHLFGLSRPTSTSEYSSFEIPNDKTSIDMQSKLTALLARILEVSSGSRGLCLGQLNVWRARWMSLATASAFQYSSMIQMRSFTALGALAISDVDDDFMYQMLMAFRTALAQPENSDTVALVSMLRCITKVLPGLPHDSRHIPQLFWLGVAFLQSSHMAFFEEAASLVSLSVKEMEKRGMFEGSTLSFRLLNARSAIEEPAQQFDSTLQLSYDTNFSFSLAAVVFKGVRHTGLKDAAEEVLRTMLSTTVRAASQAPHDSMNGYANTLDPDALGYFLALIPLSTTKALYRRLLTDCDLDESLLPEEEAEIADESAGLPIVSMDFLGINDPTTALFATSFIGVILMTAQGDDAETEILYGLLAEIANIFPETIQMVYESLQDRIKYIFANSSNPAIIRYVSDIIRIALDESFRVGENHIGPRMGVLRNSSSTVNTLDESSSIHGPSRNHQRALEEQGMQGLTKNFQFLQSSQPTHNNAAARVLNLISNLVTLMVS
ncbi:hypothetical protein K435DRAFT_835905 [Dendrothele bispora CBS 962.96]|uniref:Ras-GAP domain-containing protein n=1 Tax=Dendrothele bispora (strain CBS 962.96) TaxID=1314807 RepID=A0A4S8MKK0_DENBC|nr:hypothetical protein K435DRAFT_835905 [Dendrothele bispora CBS 962.96]